MISLLGTKFPGVQVCGLDWDHRAWVERELRSSLAPFSLLEMTNSTLGAISDWEDIGGGGGGEAYKLPLFIPQS